jgi:hypothetical protein
MFDKATWLKRAGPSELIGIGGGDIPKGAVYTVQFSEYRHVWYSTGLVIG